MKKPLLALCAMALASVCVFPVDAGAAGVESPCAAQSDSCAPFTLKHGLFDAAQRNTLGLAEIPGAETVTVYTPAKDTDKFSHGVVLCPFKGWLHAIWQSTPRDEDTTDSRVMWSRSRDGRVWSAPVEIGAQIGDGKHLRGPGGIWSNGSELIALFLKSDGWSPGTVKVTEARVSRDGENWLPIREVTPLGTMGCIQPLPSGRLLASIQAHCVPGDKKMYALPVHTDDPSGLSGWKLAEMPHPKNAKHPHYGRGIEPAWYLRADGRPVMVFRDMNRSGFQLACVGSPDGEKWTEPVVTEMPDSHSLQCAGNLPDGTAYLVNNPINTPGQRFPLVITLSADGKHFDRAHLLRDTPQPKRFEGRHKAVGFSYPSATIWGDRLCVAYATNKEEVEITFVPVKALMLNQAK